MCSPLSIYKKLICYIEFEFIANLVNCTLFLISNFANILVICVSTVLLLKFNFLAISRVSIIVCGFGTILPHRKNSFSSNGQSNLLIMTSPVEIESQLDIRDKICKKKKIVTVIGFYLFKNDML